MVKLREARNGKPPANAAKRKQIDRNKLIGAESWTDEASRWKWRRGVFHSVTSADPVKRRIFQGMRLVEEDILRLLATARRARQRDASNAGAPRKGEAWDDVWLAILAVATEGPFTEQRLGQQQQMVTTVLRMFGPKDTDAPLSPTVIEATVSKIYARFFSRSQN